LPQPPPLPQPSPLHPPPLPQLPPLHPPPLPQLLPLQLLPLHPLELLVELPPHPLELLLLVPPPPLQVPGELVFDEHASQLPVQPLGPVQLGENEQLFWSLHELLQLTDVDRGGALGSMPPSSPGNCCDGAP
jgi:hypothetical protein